MGTKGFVIHLARAATRRPQAEALVARVPVPTRILPAIDGVALDEREPGSFYRRHLHQPTYPFALSRSEIATFLSHRRAWQAILDEGCDAGLVMEDDVAPAASVFSAVILAALSVIRPDELIRFPFVGRGEQGPVIRALGPARFIEPWIPGLNAQMQLIGREAAHRLLQTSAQFDRPVDVFAQMRWLHGARILSARPIVISEISHKLGGSLIHVRRRLPERIYREMVRPLYRAQIALRLLSSWWRWSNGG